VRLSPPCSKTPRIVSTNAVIWWRYSEIGRKLICFIGASGARLKADRLRPPRNHAERALFERYGQGPTITWVSDRAGRATNRPKSDDPQPLKGACSLVERRAVLELLQDAANSSSVAGSLDGGRVLRRPYTGSLPQARTQRARPGDGCPSPRVHLLSRSGR
jgi:hypothetical protein